jgi:hypothetical protein
MALSDGRDLDSEAMGPSPEETAAVAQAIADVEGDRFPQVVRALRNPNFRLFWSGNFLSNIGTWMQNVAQGWLVLVLSGNSAFWLGVVGFVGSIPFLFFTLFGGVIADRVDKRRLLLVTQTVMMLLAFLLAACMAEGDHGVGGGGHCFLQRRGHGDECAELPGAGAAAGEARRPDQRHRAELRAVQHVAHSGADAGRVRDGAAGGGGELLPQRAELSCRSVCAYAD